MPIELFNPLRNVTVAETVPPNELRCAIHLLGESVGLALRSVNDCPIELNVCPAKIGRRRELEKRRPFIIAAAACFILSLLGWGTYYARATRLTDNVTAQLQQKIEIMRAAEMQLDKLKKQIGLLDDIARPLITAIDDRGFWPELLEDLNARLPKEDIWITELVPISGGKPINILEAPASASTTALPPDSTTKSARPKTEKSIDGILVRGLYLFNPKQQEVVVDYFRNLVSSSLFKIDPNNPARVIKSTIPNDKEWAFEYELHLDLRKSRPLP